MAADITTPLSEGREEDLFAHCKGIINSQANKEDWQPCIGMPLDPRNDWCLSLESGSLIKYYKDHILSRRM